MKQKGISLIESLLALTFFLVIILASFEFFGTTRKVFFKLQGAQMAQESAMAALDKIRTDVHKAGQGLIEPINLGAVSGIESADGALIVMSAEKNSVLLADAQAGQTTLSLEDAGGFTAGKTVCLFDKNKGEALKIVSVSGQSVTLASPLSLNYAKEESVVLLLYIVTFYLDAEKSTLRRKVNAGTPQPLLENVQYFASGYDAGANLTTVGLRLTSGSEKIHEITVFPKNMALARSR
jgi:Tfp pilus assembly protein PilW